MSQLPPPDWDPREAAVRDDQQRAYDTMRERCPVAYSDFLGWSLFRHQDVSRVLADPATYSSAAAHRAVPNGMDPPDHTAYRGVLEPYFQPDQMQALEPRCRQLAVDLLQGLRGRDDVEFISAFAQPFAFQTLCLFVGWPAATGEQLRGWAHGNQAAAFSHDHAAGATLAHEFAGYVTEALRVRRAAGGTAPDDLLSRLMATTVAGATLSDEDIVSLLRNWTAGHGTVAAALGIVVGYLAAHADLQQQLRQTPARLPAASEEILRADGPLVANQRTTTCAVAIEGRPIAAGEKLTLQWLAANRDGRVFDNPTAVQIERDPAANLLFGAGIHYCLGAPLARLELRVALAALLAHTTQIALSTTEPLRREVYPGAGFQALPLRLR